MDYIPEDSLKNLHQYRYGGVDKSLVSRYILTPYWNNLVKVFPLWVAPNLITLIGLSIIGVNVATLFYYTSELGPCPNWVYYSFGIGLFAYQSLDAIDGKQARRTGSSGPLGELFDHGCDAINTSLGVLTWASSTSLGQSWWTVLSLMASLGNFYLSTWEEYHTGILYLGHFSGPVEGVLMLVAVHLTSGYFGPAVWTLRLDEAFKMIDWTNNHHTRLIGTLQLNHLLIVIGFLVLILNIVTGLINVISVKLKPTDYSSGKDRSIVKAMLGLTPFITMCYLSYHWMCLWPDLVSEHLALFIIIIGLFLGYQVGLMIVAHVAKLSFPYFNLPVIGLLSLGNVYAYLENEGYLSNAKDHRTIVLCMLVFAVLQYVTFALSTIRQICHFLNIGCLYIKHKKTN
ncbi:CDP-alcohol phosphatidyltransferase-domain-containing protein [Chlamydoabsidia padenii]|nr:CDP-alcohol phosphatidyltransferase-domain-containing protein [Chlamydoabsidia padenii]